MILVDANIRKTFKILWCLLSIMRMKGSYREGIEEPEDDSISEEWFQ